MKNNEQYKYILFPLPLLQEVFKKPKNGISDIFYYGIYRVAIAQDVDEYSAIKQALYCYYRGGLTDYLKREFEWMSSHDVFCQDDYYSGFGTGGEFDPEDEISAISDYLEQEEDLKNIIIEFHQLRQVKAVLNLSLDNPEHIHPLIGINCLYSMWTIIIKPYQTYLGHLE